MLRTPVLVGLVGLALSPLLFAAAPPPSHRTAALLRQALDKGLKGEERLPEEDELLRPLADRPAYGALLKELRARPRSASAGSGP